MAKNPARIARLTVSKPPEWESRRIRQAAQFFSDGPEPTGTRHARHGHGPSPRRFENPARPLHRQALSPLPASNKESDRLKRGASHFAHKPAGRHRAPCDYRQASAQAIATSGWCAESRAPAERPAHFHSGAEILDFLQLRLEEP